jgi:hypothetical protein
MPSLFNDLMGSAGVALLLDTVGEIVTITPEGGEPVSLIAVLGNIRTVEKQFGSGQGRKKVAQRDCTITDSPSGPYGGIAVALKNMIVTIPGGPGASDETWTVGEIHRPSGGLWKLVLENHSLLERTREQYRSTG